MANSDRDTKWLRWQLGLESSYRPKPAKIVDGKVDSPAETVDKDVFLHPDIWRARITQSLVRDEVRSEEQSRLQYLKDIQDAWADFWDVHVSQLIREKPQISPPPAATVVNSAHEASTTVSVSEGPISESVLDSPGVDLHEIAGDRYAYEPYPYDLIRAMRRVFARFNTEAFVEDRTFPDYRNHLDQEWIALYEEAREFAKRANETGLVLKEIDSKFVVYQADDRYRSAPYPDWQKVRKQLAEMICAIQEAEAQIEQVGRLHDSGYTARIFEKLRVLHVDVQSGWGTWARQVKEPALTGAKWTIFSLAIYVCIAHAFPTYFWFSLCALLPFLAFGERYFAGRAGQDKEINAVIKQLAIFHPEPAQSDDTTLPRFKASAGEVGVAARKYTIWYPSDVIRPDTAPFASPANYVTPYAVRLDNFRTHVVGLGNLFYSRIMSLKVNDKTYTKDVAEDFEGAYRPNVIAVSNKKWAFWRMAVLSFLIAFAVIPHFWGIWKARKLAGAAVSYVVEGSTHQGTCEFGAGQILWPGPWEVVVWSPELGGLWAVPRERVVRIVAANEKTSRGGPCAERAVPISTPTPIAVAVHLSPQSQSHKLVWGIPFPEAGKKRLSCSGALQGQVGAVIGPDSVSLLASISATLAACKTTGGKLPVVDVRGFASSLDFAAECGINSDARNKELAEVRRESVLRAMQSKHGRFILSDGKWVAPFAVLDPPQQERWTSFQHMRDAQTIRDKLRGETSPERETLSRQAQIWYIDVEDCDAFKTSSEPR